MKGFFVLFFCSIVGVLYPQDHLVEKIDLALPETNPKIESFTIDSHGFVWFIYNNTVFRFDGFESEDVLYQYKNKVNQFLPKTLFFYEQYIYLSDGVGLFKRLCLQNWRLDSIPSDEYLQAEKKYATSHLKSIPEALLQFPVFSTIKSTPEYMGMYVVSGPTGLERASISGTNTLSTTMYLSMVSRPNIDSKSLEFSYHYMYNSKAVVEMSEPNELVSYYLGLPIHSSDPSDYQYKIKGLSNGFQQQLSYEPIRLMNIAPGGPYDILIKYSENGEAKSLGRIVKTPKYYETLGFYVLLLGGFISLFYTGYYLKIRRINKNNELRARIAGDLHDEVGSSLSAIALQSEYLANSKQEIDRQMLRGIQRLAQNAMSATSDIIWSIDARKDSWDDFCSRLEKYAHEYFVGSATAVYLNLSVPTTSQKLMDQSLRQHLYYMFKESLANVLKHANATEVQVYLKVSFSSQSYKFCVSDNGIGFESQEKYEGLGLHQLKKRATIIHAELQINSSEKGTEICISGFLNKSK